jgi:hypothetical protein
MGNGVCIPTCTFGTDGSAAQGCAGHDTCVPLNFLLDPTSGTVLGVGFCQGTCQTDSDCSALGATFGCQADVGFCTRAKKTRTKALGTACTNSPPGTASDTQNGACNCFSNLIATAGYCTSSCVVGGTPCPNGWVCEALETPTLTFQGAAADGGDLVIPGPPTQNPGLAGVCMQPCTLADAGGPSGGDASAADAASGDASAAAAPCPALASCVAGTLVGPDCQPM